MLFIDLMLAYVPPEKRWKLPSGDFPHADSPDATGLTVSRISGSHNLTNYRECRSKKLKIASSLGSSNRITVAIKHYTTLTETAL
jgi:hypothetical protein